MVRKMSLEYIVLFEGLLEITRKITFNTTSQEIKQQLADVTNSIIEDIIYVLNYTSKNGYNVEESQGRILSKFQIHQERLNTIIEQLAIRKICSKCGEKLPATTRFYYKNCNAKDGLRNDCRSCHKATQKELYNQRRKCSKNLPLVEKEDFINEEYENIIQD